MAFPQLFARNDRGTVQLCSNAARMLSPDQGMPEPTYHSAELFGGENRITIAHLDQHYSLRITSQGKLLLTK